MNSLLNILLPSQKIDLSKESHQQVIGLQLVCVNIAREAFSHYLKRSFKNFDPLVGENGCQIRVTMLQEIIKKGEINEARLKSLIKNLENIRQQLLSPSGFPEGAEPLESFTEQEKFLILCYILTCIRDPDQENLKSQEGLLNHFSDQFLVEEKHLKEMSFHTKKLLSESSVKYLQKTVSETNPLLKKMLAQIEDASGQGVKCSPFYFGLKALVEKLKEIQAPIILDISEKSKTIFQFDENKSLQKIKDPTAILTQPAFVVSCDLKQEKEGEYLQDFDSFEVDQVIPFLLAQAADHPLFSGKQKEQNMRLFEHPDIKPHLMTCKGASLEEVQLKISEKLSAKNLRMAKAVCQPVPFEQIILAHSEFTSLKEQGRKTKQVIEIKHIFCNTVQNEL